MPQPATKKRKPSFDIALDRGGESGTGWVYRSDRPMVAPSPEVEIIPPLRPSLERIAPRPPAPPAVEAPTLALTALSVGLAAAMLPLAAAMFAVLVPVRLIFGEARRR